MNYIDIEIKSNIQNLASKLEPMISSKDLFKTRNLLWSIKSDSIKWISFNSSSNENFFSATSTLVGDFTDDLLLKEYEFGVSNNGLYLGTIHYSLSPIQIGYSILKKDFASYLLLIGLFLLLLTFSIQRVISILFSVEKSLLQVTSLSSETNLNPDLDSIFSNLKLKNHSSDILSNLLVSHLKKIVGTYSKIKDLQVNNEILKARSDVAAEIAHDIRAPLTALNISIATIENIDSQSLSVAKHAIRRINGIANNLLKNNRIDTTEIIQNPQKTAKNDSIKTSLQLLFEEKKIQFSKAPEVSFIFDAPDLSDIDITLPTADLNRVVSNLISNSFESITGAGEVRLAARKYRKHVAITVSDTGSGMSQETLEKLGNRGFSTKRLDENSGNGIGVSHAIQTIEKYNGRIAFSSQLGQGTTVTMQIPLCV